ncbi:Asp-tRNA(Asn)/Glu-tRNA(Gln) amidotransferase subunit GatB [Chloroflexota bacterium]
MNYETVIGLEVHIQLQTKSKMFCFCSTDYASSPPNTHVCPVCLGMPGVLPTINQQAIEYTIMTALALNCNIPESTKFDRKNYPYPDLMKGYQISQYDAPVGCNGWLNLQANGNEEKVGIIRIHLEEDVAKLLHFTPPDGEAYSLVDVNRSGVPLMEIVSEPDLRSPEGARQYLIKLRSILQYLGVSTANMEEGSFRCDANISIRPEGSSELLTKVEVKNMNSFRAVYRALEYEAKRQRKAAEEDSRLIQETRGWVEEKGVTVSHRSKEYAHDYRYFPEPDLPPLIIRHDWIEKMWSKLPELPEARRKRFMAEYNLSLYDATLLTSSKVMADYFEACLKAAMAITLPNGKMAKTISNWLLGEFSRLLNATNTKISDSKINPEQLFQLLYLLEKGDISGTSAKGVFEEMFSTGKDAAIIVAQRGMKQIEDTTEVEKAIAEVIQANTQAVNDYRKGKTQSLIFLVGQVMKATRGRANPKLINELLKKRLEE